MSLYGLWILSSLFLSTELADAWHSDVFTIVNDKILKSQTPLLSRFLASGIACSVLCTELDWQCFGANIRWISGTTENVLCELFALPLANLSTLEDSIGDMYIDPGRPKYWAGRISSGNIIFALLFLCLHLA